MSQLELQNQEEYHYPHTLRESEEGFGRKAYDDGAKAKRAGLPMKPISYANKILTLCWLNGYKEAQAPK